MIGYLLFGGILILLATAVVAAAVRSGKRSEVIADPARAREDMAIEALRALEFEFQTGKLAEDEYGKLRRELEVEAVRARDETRAGGTPDDGGGAAPDTSVDTTADAIADATADASSEPSARDEAAGAATECANCGNELDGGESFCTRCGAALR